MSKRQDDFDRAVAPARAHRAERIAAEMHAPGEPGYHENACTACNCEKCRAVLTAIVAEYELTAAPARAAFWAARRRK